MRIAEVRASANLQEQQHRMPPREVGRVLPAAPPSVAGLALQQPRQQQDQPLQSGQV